MEQAAGEASSTQKTKQLKKSREMFEKILQNKAGCAFTNVLVWKG